MDSRMVQLLAELAARLNERAIVWGLGGSAMLHYYGLAEDPRDLDLLIAETDADRAAEALQSMGRLEELPPKPPYCSKRFIRLYADGMETDLIALFRLEHSSGVYEYGLDTGSITRNVRVENTDVPLTAPEDWYVLYQLMGRVERALSLEEYFRSTGIAHPERLVAALRQELPEEIKGRVTSLLAAVGSNPK